MSLFKTVRYSLWTMRQFAASRASPEKVLGAQHERLRRLLRHTVSRSAFYREKFQGIDVDRCPLSELPTTTKGELMARFDEVITVPEVRRTDVERFVDNPANVGRLFLDRYAVFHTSGSQGQPLLIVQDSQILDLLFAFQMTRGNVNYRFGPIEAARRLFSPARIAVIISRPGFFPSAWVWQHLPKGLQPYVRLLYTQAGPDLVDRLNAFGPTVLTATPTTLDLLAVHAKRLQLPKLRQVVTWSETLMDAARTRIRTAFRVPVLDNYGCGECLFLSSGCATHPGAHVNADWAILEAVDENNRPVPPGQLGYKALLTNLANTVQPLIRYEIGDRLQMATEPCACGNRLPRIERVLGRAADFFWVRSGTGYRPLTAYPFQHAFDYLREVREWQATQRGRNNFLVCFELLPGTTLDLARARQGLNERLGLAGFNSELEIELQIVPRLAINPETGKFRRLVSLVGPPADLNRPEVPTSTVSPAEKTFKAAKPGGLAAVTRQSA